MPEASNNTNIERRPLIKAVSFDDTGKHVVNVNPAGSRRRTQSLRGMAGSVSSEDEIVSGVRVKPQRRFSKRKPTGHRLVEKNGKRNVRSKHLPRDRYIQDIFTTIMDAKWRWMIFVFTLFYLGRDFYSLILFKFDGTNCF